MTNITTSFYLDLRSVLANGESPLKISISKKGSSAYIPLGISLRPNQWDSVRKRVVNHPQKATLNTLINQRKIEIDNAVLDLLKAGRYAHMTTAQLKNRILSGLREEEVPGDTFAARMDLYIKTLPSTRTQSIYMATVKALKRFTKNYKCLTFEDMSVSWLNKFDAFLAQTSPSRNARNIHFRNIRAVFNDARRNRVTNEYPFGRGFFEIKPEKTRKRSLPIDTLRAIFTATLKTWQEKYRDIFKLTFMLIGINYVDLYNMTSIVDGRIEYKRAKTGRLYSIRLEPEIQELLDTYSGTTHLLYMADLYSNYRVGYMQLCKGLNSIKETLGLPELTTYWARHSWATIASSLGIQRDTIAHALGHGSETVTDIYIDFDQKHVDDANRKVLDWVLYGKK